MVKHEKIYFFKKEKKKKHEKSKENMLASFCQPISNKLIKVCTAIPKPEKYRGCKKRVYLKEKKKKKSLVLGSFILIRKH